jgi:hypothetical protein
MLLSSWYVFPAPALIMNRSDGFRHVTGRKELDSMSDFWADHDEDCHGDMESFSNDVDYAEEFVWTCCREYGDADGCKYTTHKPSTKRARR